MTHHIIHGHHVSEEIPISDYLLSHSKSTVLDPRISYQGLLADCGDDVSLKSHLELSKEQLAAQFQEQYICPSLPVTTPQSSTPVPSSASPQKVNFTAWYKQRARLDIDKLEEFFKLPPEDFDNCDLVQWWAGRRTQFPNLSPFARDILSIPGKSFLVLIQSHLVDH
jgi:hypothetical protein